MEFTKGIEIVKEALQKVGTRISQNDYDGLIVKKLEASNTLDDGRTTNQTHIAITGSQMDIFPYLRSDGYFDSGDSDLKKYFITQIPVVLDEDNMQYLQGDNYADGIDYIDGKAETTTSIVRSKRQNQADQIQVSLLNFDGQEFVKFRRQLISGTILIVLKMKEQFKYAAFGIRGDDCDDELNELNNQFLKLNTNTAVNTKVVIAKPAVGGMNKIYYGAPGCGKSHHVKGLLEHAGVKQANIVRTTFHPEYANCDFVGQIMPKITIDEDEDTGAQKKDVEYEFRPGPFTIALQKAYMTNDMVYLIIEEINRGNAAAIFGDMFQLLDREKDTHSADFSSSEYPVSNPNLQEYLSEFNYGPNDSVIKHKLSKGIYIPSNLTIFATMNTSDQNVFTLDTAFKRRWLFELVDNDIEHDGNHHYRDWYIPGTDVTWAKFVTKLNDKILDYKIHNQTNEDKRLGKYFVTPDCLTENPEQITDEGVREKAEIFAYKVLEYIWNDVCKIGREEWFETDKYKTLEDLIAEFKNNTNPLSIFQNITFN